ncbi:TadE family protein [Streptomyces buecherae]|uniref:TadE family protein n=1 Tax=Streptomyces buecherae TaxID=2763006 RepID=UPI0036C87605
MRDGRHDTMRDGDTPRAGRRGGVRAGPRAPGGAPRRAGAARREGTAARRVGTAARWGDRPSHPPHGRARCRRRAGERRRDAGSVAVEFLGFLPILLAVGLAVVQLGIAAYTVQQAGTAARAAARTATADDPEASPESAGQAAISGWLADGARISVSGGTEAHATATVEIPSIIPGVDFGDARRSATMRRPEPADPPAPGDE